LHAALSRPDAESRGTPPLVLLHGFTQTSELWGPFGDALNAANDVVRVDLPGHGHSTGVLPSDLWAAGEAVLDAAEALIEPPFTVCGYSLGGRTALHAALARPDTVSRLVLLSATAGIEDDGRRSDRQARDRAMADELEASGDVAAFVDRWLAQPMFAHVPPDAAGVEARKANTAAGLAGSLRHYGAGTQQPLWDRLSKLSMPTLCVAGATDPRFVTQALHLAGSIPNGTASAVPGAGHAVHLEQPRLVGRLVTGWLASLGD
jgi:2-succinyl-6-hydroxy-2,4-cyclohexadiene-1-carboxylate synthase